MPNEMICISAEDLVETMVRSGDEVLDMAKKTLDDTTYHIVVALISRYEATVASKLVPTLTLSEVMDRVFEKLDKEKSNDRNH